MTAHLVQRETRSVRDAEQVPTADGQRDTQIVEIVRARVGVVRGEVDPFGDETVRAQGFWDDKSVSILVTPQRFQSTSGRCGYGLERTVASPPTYEGRTVCGKSPTTLILPSDFFQRSKMERAMFLTAFLYD